MPLDKDRYGVRVMFIPAFRDEGALQVLEGAALRRHGHAAFSVEAPYVLDVVRLASHLDLFVKRVQ
jgi:hypothetical protein